MDERRRLGWLMGMVWACGCVLPGVDGGSIASSEGSSSATSTGETGEVPAICGDLGWDDSYAKFRSAEADAGGHYWYEVSDVVYSEDLVPVCTYTTTVEIADGKPIRRVLSPPMFEDGPSAECSEPGFDEIGEDVGTHDVPEARAAWTLDQLYDACCFDVLAMAKPDEQEITFQTTDGLLHQCFVVELECGEGCTLPVEGFGDIALDRIEFGPLPD